MNYRRFIQPLLLLISSAFCSYSFVYNWSLRHPYLVFFQSSTTYISRFSLVMLIFLSALLLIRTISHNLVPANKKSSAFYVIDNFLNLILGPILYFRFHFPGRREGNLFYLKVAISAVIIKIILSFCFSTKESRAMFFKLWLKDFTFLMAVGQFIKQKKEYNFYYIGLLGLLSSALSIAFVYSLGLTSYLIALLYALIASISLIFFHHLFSLKSKKIIEPIMAYLSFFVLVLGALDFLGFQSTHQHIIDNLGALFAEGVKGVPQMLEGADVGLIGFIITIVICLSIPLFGIIAFKKLPKRKVSFSLLTPLLLISGLIYSTYFCENYAGKKLAHDQIETTISHLALKPLFLKTPSIKVKFGNSLKQPPSEQELLSTLSTLKNEKLDKPHVFLFVIESLRDDYLNESTAPFITSLKESCPKFEAIASNSCVTVDSIFAIYNSLFSHHWLSTRNAEHQMGSLPLNILKKIDYKLHAFHSSYFKYCNIGPTLFGKDYHLLDTRFEAKELSTDVAIRDQMIIDRAKNVIEKVNLEHPQFLTFQLDSTHHHYYWPQETFDAKFKPYLESFNYANKGQKQLLLTKNRYKNSIVYVDHLIEEFCNFLKENGLYDNSLIIITADHAEEFLEHGRYFHGTSLCHVQSQIPMIYKLPKNSSKSIEKKITSQVDIFPTVLDYIGIDLDQSPLNGSSALKNQNNYLLSFKPCHRNNPNEFYFYDGEHKFEAKLSKPHDTYSSKSIEITAVKDLDEKTKPLEVEETKSLAHQGLDFLFNSSQ